MEVLLWSTILVLVSSYIFFQLMKLRKSPGNDAVLPPSPPKLPVIGHIHLLSGGLPQRKLRHVAQRYGGVVLLRLSEISCVVISSREAAEQVMKTADLACAEMTDQICTGIVSYGNNDIIFSSYGAHWRQMRRILVSEVLIPSNLRSFGLIREEETARLVGGLLASAGAAVDVTEKITEMTCSVTCRAAFGGAVRDGDVLVRLVKEAAALATGLELADLFPSSRLLSLLCWNKYRLRKMRCRLDAVLDGVVEEHRVKKRGKFGGKDVVDVLLRMLLIQSASSTFEI